MVLGKDKDWQTNNQTNYPLPPKREKNQINKIRDPDNDFGIS